MGTKTYAQFDTAVRAYLKLASDDDDPASLTPDDVAAFVDEAVGEHSRYRPRVVTDLTLDGTGSATDFRLDNLAVPYEDGFSSLLRVEHPTGNAPPSVLVTPDDYAVSTNSSGQAVVSFVSAPASGTNNIRVDYTARHTVSPTAPGTNTTQDADFWAICHLAAAYAFLALAGRGAHAVAPTIGASEVGPRTASDVYRALAKEHRSQYLAHLGIDERAAGAGVAAAGTIRDWDSGYLGGRDRLTHPRRYV